MTSTELSADGGPAQQELRIGAGVLLVENDGKLLRARGVRYGTAARFAPAEPVPAWSGVVDATRRGPVCPQLPSILESVMGSEVAGLTADEDCLVLSVTAPADADGLPVMVWVHGGAFMSGGGESPDYDPDLLVLEGRVVVVSVTYRLGVLGFLAPEQAGGAVNLGSRDQLLALRWVHDNIADFGGNPDEVTLFGQSAGGVAVYSLLLCEQSAGLVRRAIVQSAPISLLNDRAEMTAAQRRVVSAALGDTAPAEATVEALLAAQEAATMEANRFGMRSGLPFGPVLGHAPLPAQHEVPDRIAEVAKHVDLLTGFTKDDVLPFVTMQPKLGFLGKLGAPGQAVARLASNVMTPKLFGGPAEKLTRAWTAAGGKAAGYRFEWSPANGKLGACHCIELPFLLGAPDAWADAPMLAGQPVAEGLATRMRRSWTDFAHGGVDALESRSLWFG